MIETILVCDVDAGGCGCCWGESQLEKGKCPECGGKELVDITDEVVDC